MANDAAQAVSEKAAKAKSVEQDIKMDDGKIDTFVGKRKMLKESGLDESGKIVVRLAFINGKVIKFTPPDSLLTKFAAHGVEQKLGDETAGTQDVDDMILDVENLIARLEKGEWTKAREGGGMGGASILIRAMAEYGGKSVEQVKDWMKGTTKAQRDALTVSPRIKPIIERLQAERAAKATSVNTDELLEGFASAG